MWHNVGFHAGKESIIGVGVSNIMITPIIDYFCACPPITVSLSESRTSSASLCSSGRTEIEVVQASRKIKLDKKVFQDRKQSVITAETAETAEGRKEKSRAEKKKPRLGEVETQQHQLPVPTVQIIQQGSSEREILDSIALTKTKLGKKEEKQARSAGRKGKRRKEKKEKTRAAAPTSSGETGRTERAERRGKAEKVEKEFCEKCYEKKLRRKMERERERELLRAEEQQIVFDPEEPFVDRHIEEAEVMRRYIETEKVYDDTISIKSYCVCSLHAEDHQSPYKLSQQKMEQVRDAVLVVRNWKHSKQHS